MACFNVLQRTITRELVTRSDENDDRLTEIVRVNQCQTEGCKICCSTETNPRLRSKKSVITYSDLLPAVKTGVAVKSSATCLCHNRKCRWPEADIHWAGTSCVAWSLMGSRKGKEDDSIVPFMSWLAMRSPAASGRPSLSYCHI